jgi:hypothetical protein
MKLGVSLSLKMMEMMRRDDVSELWTPPGLLFIPQVIYEHEKP